MHDKLTTHTWISDLWSVSSNNLSQIAAIHASITGHDLCGTAKPSVLNNHEDFELQNSLYDDV